MFTEEFHYLPWLIAEEINIFSNYLSPITLHLLILKLSINNQYEDLIKKYKNKISAYIFII